MEFIGKLMGDPNKRELKLIQPIINKINALEPEMKELSDEELSGKTREFRAQLALHLKGGLVLEDELLKLFREALESVEPRASALNDAQLRGAISEYRQKIDRRDAEEALKVHLQDTLSECFEQGYEKLSPLLDKLRVIAAMDRAEERQEWPDEAIDPQKVTFGLLEAIDPAFKEIDDDVLDEVFAPAWERFEERRGQDTA